MRSSYAAIKPPASCVQQTTWDRPEVKPPGGSPPQADEGDVAHLLKGMGLRAAPEGHAVEPSEVSETETSNAFRVHTTQMLHLTSAHTSPDLCSLLCCQAKCTKECDQSMLEFRFGGDTVTFFGEVHLIEKLANLPLRSVQRSFRFLASFSLRTWTTNR